MINKSSPKKNKNVFRTISAIFLLSIVVFNIFLMSAFQQNSELKFIGFFIALIFQFLLCVLVLPQLIEDSINKNTTYRKATSFLTNLLFSVSTIAFIINGSIINELYFQLTNIFVLMIIAVVIKKFTNVEKGNDFSYLKSINLFMVSIYIGVVFLLEKYLDNNELVFFINYYYLFPLLMLQGVYDLLEGKTK